MKKIDFIFTIHNHQPDGNFDFVIKNALDQAYHPFLKILSRHPSIRIAIHHSGCLLEWIENNHPGYFDLLGELTERNQIELIGGGFYEPIIPLIPDHDKIGQVKYMSDWLSKKFGVTPRGAWIAERVWEQQTASVLHKTGVEFTFLDDFHFKLAGVDNRDLFSYYVTEDNGKTLSVFPISQFLRYSLPFREPETTIEYLRRKTMEIGNPVVIFADDGEKFGIWPGTHHLCYHDKWLERFFRSLEDNSDWIQTILPSEYIDKNSPAGRIYIPDSSYMEMMEWSLLPAGVWERGALLEQYGPTNGRHMISGGFFRNFLVKYPESNNMHKKMLHVSAKVDAASKATEHSGAPPSEMQKELWRGQCNCAYWHGIFGGLYLKHLRNAVYRRLISAEKFADKIIPPKQSEIVDFDCDGKDEIIISSANTRFILKPSEGGMIVELDFLPFNYNLVDVLGRRRESYHHKIENQLISENDSHVASIHDQTIMKEKGLEKYLFYDRYRRGILIDHFFPGEMETTDLLKENFRETADFAGKEYEFLSLDENKDSTSISMKRNGFIEYDGKKIGMEVRKEISIVKIKDRLEVTYSISNHSETKRIETFFGVEFCLAMIDGNSPDRYYFSGGDNSKIGAPNSAGKTKDCSIFGLKDDSLGFSVKCETDRNSTWYRYPLETVSMSEGGFEKNYQGSVFIPSVSLSIDPLSTEKIKLSIDISRNDNDNN